MTRYSVAYFAAALIFLAMDMIWLGVVAKDTYRSQLGHLIIPEFRAGPAALFYLIYIAGIVYFAISAGISAGSWQAALLPGALFGLMAYGTYDLTNWAVMRDWPAGITFIDLAWGTFLTSLAAAVGAGAALRVG